MLFRRFCITSELMEVTYGVGLYLSEYILSEITFTNFVLIYNPMLKNAFQIAILLLMLRNAVTFTLPTVKQSIDEAQLAACARRWHRAPTRLCTSSTRSLGVVPADQ